MVKMRKEIKRTHAFDCAKIGTNRPIELDDSKKHQSQNKIVSGLSQVSSGLAMRRAS